MLIVRTLLISVALLGNVSQPASRIPLSRSEAVVQHSQFNAVWQMKCHFDWYLLCVIGTLI